jgi:hypothetical protein
MNRPELENALAELRAIEHEAVAMIPDNDGGDTAALCRQGIEAIEFLLGKSNPWKS